MHLKMFYIKSIVFIVIINVIYAKNIYYTSSSTLPLSSPASSPISSGFLISELTSYDTHYSNNNYYNNINANKNRIKRASDSPKFSIGLGTLSPSYSQKFGNNGDTKLDFNSEKNGFSYSLSNVNHPVALQSGESQSTTTKESANNKNTNQNTANVHSNIQQQHHPNVNIYHQQGYNPYIPQMNPFFTSLSPNYNPTPYNNYHPSPDYSSPTGHSASSGQASNLYNNPQSQYQAFNPNSYSLSSTAFYPGGYFPNYVNPSTTANNDNNNKIENKQDSKSNTTATYTSNGFNYGFTANHASPYNVQSFDPLGQINPYITQTGYPLIQSNNNEQSAQQNPYGFPIDAMGLAALNQFGRYPLMSGSSPYSMYSLY